MRREITTNFSSSSCSCELLLLVLRVGGASQPLMRLLLDLIVSIYMHETWLIGWICIQVGMDGLGEPVTLRSAGPL